MWLSDKKQLWSIEQNISLFKANLEECEIGLRKKRKTCARALKMENDMGKIYTRKILFVIAAMLLCVLVAILIRLFFSNRTIRMTLTPIEVETGEAVHYADSTRNARSWLWEFGNGDISHERSGEYVFKEPGRYQVRLQVDGGLERKQIITVHKSRDDYGSDELVRMKAPATAFQGEIVSSKDTVRRKNGAGSSESPELSIRGSRTCSTPIQNPAYTRFC